MDLKSLELYLIELFTSIGLKIVGALLILIVGLKLIKFLKKWLSTSNKLDKIDNSVRSFLVSFSSIALYFVLFITIAMFLGIPTTSFITALASCFAAIGLAMQGSLSNFAGGLMILIFKPFKVGDYISTLDSEGTVFEITVAYTVLHTYDNRVVTIPNGALTNTIVENRTSANIRRVDLDFNAAYECDIAKVKSILMDTVTNHSLVIHEPEPVVLLSNLSDSSLTYTIRVWCKTDDYWTVKNDLIEAVKINFDNNNIEIPYNHLNVHLNSYN